MPSPKRRTTSSSGASGKSRKKDTSSRTEGLSATAPASFEKIFGTGGHPETARYHSLWHAATARKQKLLATEAPTELQAKRLHAAYKQQERLIAMYERDMTSLEIPLPGN